MHVVAADVEYPCYLVEGRDEDRRGAFLACAAQHALDFCACVLAGVTYVVDKGLALGQGGAVGPYARGVEVDDDVDAGGLEGLDEACRRRGAVHHAVDAHRGADGEAVGEPLLDVGGAVKALLHQRNARAVELTGGLDEVARVGPQQGLGGCHHQRAGRAVEAREVLAHLPVAGDVLALVRVGLRNYHGVDAVGGHQLPQFFEAGGSF